MNKKHLGLATALLLLAGSAAAQQKLSDGTVGGGISANKNAILELSSTNKGLLHSRISLTRTTEASPLTAHEAGMMVYNTASVNDVVPGIYYNDGAKWVLVSSGVSSNIYYDPSTYIISYVDENGDMQTINLVQAIKDNETKTLVVKNGGGKYTYYNEEAFHEDGTPDLAKGIVINVPADVITNIEEILGDTNVVNGLIEILGDTYVGGNVYYDGAQFTYVDQAGDKHVITFEDIVQAHETVTTLVKNADGTYTYTSEDNTVTIIDIPASVVENFETIVNDGPVTINGNTFNSIEEYIEHIANSNVTIQAGDMITVTGTGTAADPYIVSIEEGAANSMLITNAAGDLEWATIDQIVKGSETVTTLVGNNDGTYTYTNEDNTVTIIDIPASVVENFETIVNDGPVTINGNTFNSIEEYIEHIANSNVTIQAGDMITVTGTGTAADPYIVSIEEGAANSMLITNAAGDLEWATIDQIVKGSETVTTLVDNNDGTYTYTSEDNTVTIIDIPASVVENFETIVNDGPVTVNGNTFNTIEEYIEHIASSSVTVQEGDMITVTGTGTAADPYIVSIEEGAANSMLITNAAGDLEWATIDQIVKGSETVTTLVDNNDGTYTYTSEDNTVTIIDIPASVVENFETIVNDGPVTVNGNTFNSIEEYIEHLANSSVTIQEGDMITVTGTGTAADPYIVSIEEGAANSMLITNAAGDLEWATIDQIVKGSETVTTLVDNNDGTYTYTSEDNTVTIIDIPASVVENFETIVNEGPVTVNGNTFNTIEEYIEHIASSSVTVQEGDMITVTGTGTAADPYIVSIEEGAANSMLITNAAGDLEWATIDQIVKGSETVTTLVGNNDGTYTYTSEDNTVTIIDIPASVVENFETIVNDGPVTVNGNTFNSIEEYIEHIASSSVTVQEGDMITVTGTGTAADPYIVSIEEGAANSMLITNAAGDLEWATIDQIVKGSETVTTLVGNNDGTYTYTSEDNTVTIIDIPASVVENFETIVNDGPVTVNGNTFNTIEEYIEHIASSSVTVQEGDMITVTGTGTAADPYIVSIEEGAANSMLITNAAGDLEWATIDQIVKGSETVTTLVGNNDGTYTYTSEDNTVTIIDIPASVVENFETIVNDGPVTVNGNTFNTIEEYIEHIASSSVTVQEGDMITVTGTGTAADPYIVSIEEGAANSMLITNAAGDLEWATIDQIVKGSETVTTLVGNNDGTYTYTSEDNTVTIIDIPASVVENFETIVNDGPVTVNGNTFNSIEEYIEHIASSSVTVQEGDMITVTGTGTAADPYIVSIEEGAANSMLITNAAGDLEWATIDQIVKGSETVTTLVGNNDGTYTYTSEDDTVTIIDIPASVVENFETIVNDGPVTVNGNTFNTIEEYIEYIANASVTVEGGDFITVTGDGTSGNPYHVEIKEGDANSMLITNDAGELEWVTIESIVQANETVTKVVDNTDGTYTYINEDEDEFVISIPASIVESFETIVNSGPVIVGGEEYTTIEEYIEYIANASVTVEGGDFITVTGDGTSGNPYHVEIKEGDANSMLITNDAGELEWATIESIVQANETVTKVVDNTDGTYTYINEDEEEFVISIPASIVESFETIVNSGPVIVGGEEYTTIEEYIEYIANASVTVEGGDFITVTGDGTSGNPYHVEIKEGDANSMLITNDAGELEWATIESIVQANETVTKVVDNTDGTYTYINEDEDEFVISIPASIVESFETIVNSGPVIVGGEEYTTIEEYIEYIANASVTVEGGDFITVTGDGTSGNPYHVEIKEGDANSMLITNDAGELEWATIESIVQANETVTKVVDNTDGTYTYINEDEEEFVISIPASIVESFETIVNSGPVIVGGEEYTTIEEYIEYIANASVTVEGGDFITVTGDGTSGNPYHVEIKEGDANSMLITNDAGELEWATIESIVQANETVTKVVDNTDGTYTYINEDEEEFVISIPASIVESFETIVNSGPVIVGGEEYTTIEEYIEYIANASVTVEGGDFITVTGDGTSGNPYHVEIKEGDANSMLITNDAGELEWATIESIVQANETVTKVVDNTDGTYTYINEDEEEFVISIPASIVESFETIVNSGPVIVGGEEYTTIEEYIEYIANASVTVEGGDFITVTGDGTSGNPYHVEIKEGDANSMLITNDAGELEWATIESIVQANETVTKVVDNTDGTYTYINEDEEEFVISIPASIVESFETIVNSGPVIVGGEEYTTIEEYIEYIANASVTVEGGDFITVTGDGTSGNPYHVEIKEGDANSMLITNDAGELEWATIESIVQANETVTKVVDNTDGTYTYINEDEEEFVISIPASIVESFETIVNSGPVIVGGEEYTTIEEYIEYIANASVTVEGGDFITVTGDGTSGNPYHVEIKEGDANSMLITNDAGELEWATIESIVQANETVTKVVDNTDGTYTYINEDEEEFVISIPASIVESFETIVNSGPVIVGGEEYTTIEEYIEYIANASVTVEGGDFITVTGDGTSGNPYHVEIKEGDANSMLITNDAGELEWATIESIVQANETVTKVVDNTDGTYTYINEDEEEFVISIPASIVESFETIVNSGPVIVGGEEYTTIEEYIEYIANASVTVEGGDFITVTGDGTSGNPYHVEIKEGDANSMLITNDAGELEWATIESIVQANETVTKVVDNTDGTYTYINEDEEEFVISIPASIVESFETIVNDGPVTINGNTFNSIEEYIEHIASSSVTVQEGDMITVTGTGTAADPYIVSIEEGAANSMLITNAAGDLEWATIEDVVQDVQKTVTLVDGTNTTIESNVVGNNTEYKVNVATANGTTLGVVKEAATNPSVAVAADGSLSVNIANITGRGNLSATTGDNSITVSNGTNATFVNTDIKVTDGGISTAKIANNAVTVQKLPAGATNTTFLRGDGTWVTPTDNNTTYSGSTSIILDGTSFQRAALTGDVTAPQNSNVTTIANNAVTTPKIADDAVTAAKVNADVAGNGLTQAANGALQVNVNNGISIADDLVQLGGALIKPTTITATAANTLAVAGLQPTTDAAKTTDAFVVVGDNGVLKKADIKYSTTEQATGKKWVGGQVVYERVLEVNLPAQTNIITLPSGSRPSKIIGMRMIGRTDNSITTELSRYNATTGEMVFGSGTTTQYQKAGMYDLILEYIK